jgi:hypothetical protein
MRKIIFGTSLFVAFIAAGCANSQMHQSLLMHENRRLEDALYAAHAQAADLKRENDSLRGQQGNEFPQPPERSRAGSWEDDVELIQPIEMPRVILPGTTEVPESLRGSEMIPTWTPRR